MKSTPIITSFNAGEMSPLMFGRPDLEKWQSGLQLCQNMIPRVQGAVQRRGGTRYVAEVKTSANRTWLVRFEFSATDAFVLEFGHQYIRFYRNRGVLTSGGSPYEIVSPYAVADLTAADGTFALRYVQSGDVIYLVHPKYAPRKLTRLANTNWTLATLDLKEGPLLDQNTNQAVVMQASGITGTITVTANANLFSATDVGRLIYLQSRDGGGLKPWSARERVTGLGMRRISDGKVYRVSTLGDVHPDGFWSGYNKPIHTEGKYWDGDGRDVPNDGGIGSIGVEWEYLHSQYGFVRITGYTSPTQVTGTVVLRLPDEVVSATTWRWALGAFSDTTGYPDGVCFFRERLTFSKDQSLYMSVAGDFENFAEKEFGQVTLETALRLRVLSAKGNPIRWLAPGKQLLVGTGGGEHAILEQTSNQAFGAGNAKADAQSEWGSSGAQPAQIGQSVLFVERSGRKVRELLYDLNSDGFTTEDLNVFSEHLMDSAVIQMAYAQQPHSVVWCAQANGRLLGLTYMKEQGVAGWHRHVLGGSGVVESVVVVPSPDGARDELWLIVRRTINGATKRYVEVMTPEYVDGDDQALTAYSDSHLIYSGTATTTLSGLGHLEGQTVVVKVNGAAHPNRTVTGGSITLEREATKATVGLPTPYRGRTMPLEQGSQTGTGQGKNKRVSRLKARLYNSLGGKFGPEVGKTDPLEYRQAGVAMDAAPPLYTGDLELGFPGDYDGQAAIAWEGEDDFPFTLVALMPELHTHE